MRHLMQEVIKRTFGLIRFPLGSFTTNQPRRQPGTNHLFDKEPRVSTVAMDDAKAPMGTNGLGPKAR